ncbi:MAG: BadF/BadG/BcrA/BcrD ATPase family protein [Acholeplasma sp.]
MNKIISIDGGGTKTLGVLYDTSGNELKRSTKGSSNFAVDVKDASQALIEVIDELIIDNVLSIHIGLSGFSMIPDKDKLIKSLEDLYQTRVYLYPDAYLGLYSAYEKDLPLIYVVGGTGSIIYSLVDNEFNRYGGYGHLFGDQGSAYGFVMDVFWDCLVALDQNKKLNKVQKALLNHLELSTNEDVIGYTHRVKKQEIASLARLITQHQHSYVLKKIKKQAIIIAKGIEQVVKKKQLNKGLVIALRGGFLESAPNAKQEVLNYLDKKHIKYTLNRDIKEAVYGGYIRAMLSKGKEI